MPICEDIFQIGRMNVNEIPYSFRSSVMHVGRNNTLSRYVIHVSRYVIRVGKQVIDVGSQVIHVII